MSHPALAPEALRQFYFLEARLLDARRFDEWMQCLDEEIAYLMPAPQSLSRGAETLPPEGEWSRYSGGESPLREENYFTLALRAERHGKSRAWAENPPALTRRIIANVEPAEPARVFPELALVEADGAAWSNFLLHYFRHGSATLYAGQRRDLLRVGQGGAVKIVRREVLLTCGVIDPPGAGLLF